MEITVAEAPIEELEADILAFPVTDSNELVGIAAKLDEKLAGRLTHLVADGELTGKAGSVTLVHTLGELRAHRIAAVGVGAAGGVDPDVLRTAAARLAARAGSISSRTLAWVVEPGLPLPVDKQARAVVDGVVLGGYDAGLWKTAGDRPARPERLIVCGAGAAAGEDAARRAACASKWANRCRDLVNAPANELTPTVLAERAAEFAGELGDLRIEVRGPEEIRALGMGAFWSVAQGSTVEPRLIVLEYHPPDAPSEPFVGLVGKAVTFDSGGISIKPADRMDEMKTDMAGGGAALCGILAAAELGLPIRALSVIPATENMPSGSATRPGDIVTALNGKTIEVTNTDAEGRMLLADALTYTRRRGATHMLDFATLTGAVVIALGDYYAGLMGNDDAWVSAILSAAEASGDHAWQLPLHETYARLIRSDFADMKNSSTLRQAGPVYAASFLQEFTGEGPWAHLDIAGTGFLGRGREDYYAGRGATGYGVRLIAELLASMSSAS
jgi:leucyl aminopeptidase